MGRSFICKDNGSNYYIQSEGMGGFLNPPGQAEHSYSIVEVRGGHEVGSYALSSAANEEYLPQAVRSTARRRLSAAKGDVKDEGWIATVYNYFRNCYSPDGINRSASDCIVDNTNSRPADTHLAYLMVKQYDPDHQPRLDLIQQSSPAGKWHKG